MWFLETTEPGHQQEQAKAWNLVSSIRSDTSIRTAPRKQDKVDGNVIDESVSPLVHVDKDHNCKDDGTVEKS